MAYWDTSTLVKLYAKEPDSALFEAQAMSTAAVAVASRIALYEARATFQRKEAEGILQSGAAQKLYSELLQDVGTGEVRLVELGPDVEREYGQVLTLCYQQNLMSLTRMFVAGLQTVAAAVRSSPGWKRDLAMMDWRESDLPEADGKGMLPEGTLEYSRGVIQLMVGGKPVAKTRKQWLDYMCGMQEARAGKFSMKGFPYRSYALQCRAGTAKSLPYLLSHPCAISNLR